MKLPAFQFYPGDWRKDSGVQSLDFESRGVWFEMLCLMHESTPRGVLTLNGKAMPEAALARLLGIDQVLLKQILTKLTDHGVASVEPTTGAIMSRRMVRDEHLRKTRAECGKQGGNPRLLKQKSTTRVKQIPTPSSSSSVSSSDIIGGAPAPELVAKPDALLTEAFEHKWEEYIAYRKARKLCVLQPASVQKQWEEMAKWGHDAALEAIDTTIRNSWTGIFEPKPNGKGNHANNRTGNGRSFAAADPSQFDNFQGKF